MPPPVVASPISGPNFTAVPTNLTAEGFDVRTYNASDALEDKGVCFVVHALNALPLRVEQVLMAGVSLMQTALSSTASKERLKNRVG